MNRTNGTLSLTPHTEHQGRPSGMHATNDTQGRMFGLVIIMTEQSVTIPLVLPSRHVCTRLNQTSEIRKFEEKFILVRDKFKDKFILVHY